MLIGVGVSFTLLAELWYEPSDSLCTTVFRCRPSGRNNTATALLFYSLQHPGGFCFNRSFWTNVCRVNKSKFFSRGTKQDCWSSITNRRHAASLVDSPCCDWLTALVVGLGAGSCASLEWLAEWSVCPGKQIHKGLLMFRVKQWRSWTRLFMLDGDWKPSGIWCLLLISLDVYMSTLKPFSSLRDSKYRSDRPLGFFLNLG